MKIVIETKVNAPLERVWQAWVSPNEITQWNQATAEWVCPRAEIDLRLGGHFVYRMEAKDGSMGFDFGGEFTAVETYKEIEYVLEDKRKVTTVFTDTGQGVTVAQTFDAEDENSAEQQKQGWQSILNNFKQYVETSVSG